MPTIFLIVEAENGIWRRLIPLRLFRRPAPPRRRGAGRSALSLRKEGNGGQGRESGRYLLKAEIADQKGIIDEI
jgi:hypothetical protein